MVGFSIHLSEVVLDCDDAQKLAKFYADLLGWQTKVLNKDLVWVQSPDCPMCLLCNREEDYVPPVWPEQLGRQQKGEHLDFAVDDLDAAVAYAVSLGARLSTYQCMPEKWKTLFDSAGHPFCLCL